jgi:hypothetical protein
MFKIEVIIGHWNQAPLSCFVSLRYNSIMVIEIISNLVKNLLQVHVQR